MSIEIDVTEKMMKAGETAYAEHRTPASNLQNLLKAVYLAMVEAEPQDLVITDYGPEPAEDEDEFILEALRQITMMDVSDWRNYRAKLWSRLNLVAMIEDVEKIVEANKP